MKRDFEDIMKTLKSTIASYSYFVDFEKVYKNVDDVLIPLNLMNSLLNREDFDVAFISLIHKYPEVLKAVPILIAVRGLTIEIIDDGTKQFCFSELKNSDEEYLKFFEKTGLKKLFTQGKIKNLVDYVTGVEVGLDSNARKNRTGDAMETIVKDYLEHYVGKDNVLYQATKEKIFDTFHVPEINTLDLKDNGKSAEKRFDFAFKYEDYVYLVETNFYTGGGSKLNEVARSYEKLADEINSKQHLRFVWITDGKGWNSAKRNLQESYQHQDYLFTIDDLEHTKIDELLNNYFQNNKSN